MAVECLDKISKQKMLMYIEQSGCANNNCILLKKMVEELPDCAEVPKTTKSGKIRSAYQEHMSACLKGGTKLFKECVAEWKMKK